MRDRRGYLGAYDAGCSVDMRSVCEALVEIGCVSSPRTAKVCVCVCD